METLGSYFTPIREKEIKYVPDKLAKAFAVSVVKISVKEFWTWKLEYLS